MLMANGFKSFRKNGMICYSELDVILYYRLLNSPKYKSIHESLDINTFIDATYEVSSNKITNLKRKLTFIWFDLYGEEIKLEILMSQDSHFELQQMQLSVVALNRQPSNRVYSDSYMPPKNVNFSACAR
jgi:predicted ATP-dependent endonuclease of OLD family